MKLVKNLAMDLNIAAELVNSVTSKKIITNNDGEELGTRYYAEIDAAVVELDVYDGESIMDKIGYTFYLDRKSKNGKVSIWRLRRPVDVKSEAAFTDLFAALEAEKRSEAAKKAAATKAAKKAAQTA